MAAGLTTIVSCTIVAIIQEIPFQHQFYDDDLRAYCTGIAGRPLATNCKILVAIAKFSVTLATTKLQFQTLIIVYLGAHRMEFDQLIPLLKNI